MSPDTTCVGLLGVGPETHHLLAPFVHCCLLATSSGFLKGKEKVKIEGDMRLRQLYF